MKLTDDLLMAYADGELDAKTQAEVEEALAADPTAARRVAEHRALRSQLRSTFDKVLDEPVPERLLAAARSAPDAQQSVPDARRTGPDSQRTEPESRRTESTATPPRPTESPSPQDRVVIPFRPKTRPKPSVPYWGALAASFVMGALVWRFGADLYQSSPIIEQNGQLLAAGALDKALSSQLVREQSAQDAVQIGVSFRSKSGNYCRTFQVRAQSGVAGLACREDGRWQLTALASGGASGQGQPEFRPAGSALPAPILQAVEQAIDGEPLDAQTEAQAKTNQWRVK